MAFGMGFGELVLIVVIVAVVFGATKLPDLEDSLGRMLRGERVPPPRLLLERRRRWTRWDWAIVIAASVVALTAVVLSVRGRHF